MIHTESEKEPRNARRGHYGRTRNKNVFCVGVTPSIRLSPTAGSGRRRNDIPPEGKKVEAFQELVSYLLEVTYYLPASFLEDWCTISVVEPWTAKWTRELNLLGIGRYGRKNRRSFSPTRRLVSDHKDFIMS